MKRVITAMAAVMLVGAAHSWAVTNTFHITKFHGKLTNADGTKIVFSRADQITSNRTIMVVSDDAHEVTISEVSGTTTNVLLSETHAAFTRGGKFTSNLEGTFTPVSPSIPDFDGDLLFVGKISPPPENHTPRKINAAIAGVWGEDPDATFKGTLEGRTE